MPQHIHRFQAADDDFVYCLDCDAKRSILDYDSVPCGNCGTYRTVDDFLVVEECPKCHDDEFDLSIIDSESSYA